MLTPSSPSITYIFSQGTLQGMAVGLPDVGPWVQGTPDSVYRRGGASFSFHLRVFLRAGVRPGVSCFVLSVFLRASFNFVLERAYSFLSRGSRYVMLCLPRFYFGARVRFSILCCFALRFFGGRAADVFAGSILWVRGLLRRVLSRGLFGGPGLCVPIPRAGSLASDVIVLRCIHFNSQFLFVSCCPAFWLVFGRCLFLLVAAGL
ncbi:hypothetical protein B0H12DRAFT_453467 [Mycena haematopus]|nr:hypothetical protein B0H12DRAFT_453467 [Mycena haematopus]